MNPLLSLLGAGGLEGLKTVGLIDCRGYGAVLTPRWCIQNQLSDLCLPAFPCHDCEAGVGIRVAGGDTGATVNQAPRLKTCATTRKRRQALKTMSRAVARDLGLL